MELLTLAWCLELNPRHLESGLVLNICNCGSVNQCSLANQSSQLGFSEHLFAWIHLPRSSRLSNCTKFALNHLGTVKLPPAAMDLRVSQEGARSPVSPWMCFSPRAHSSRVEQEMTDSPCLLQYLLAVFSAHHLRDYRSHR